LTYSLLGELLKTHIPVFITFLTSNIRNIAKKSQDQLLGRCFDRSDVNIAGFRRGAINAAAIYSLLVGSFVNNWPANQTDLMNGKI